MKCVSAAMCRVMIVLVAVLALSSCSMGPKAMDVTVMSYNIRVATWSPDGTLKDDAAKANLKAIGEYIQNAKADVVFLQEVDRGADRSAKMDEVKELADQLGYSWYYGKTLDRSNGDYGIALISRWPIVDSRTARLYKPDYSKTHPDWPDWYAEQRVAIVAQIDTPKGKLAVINAHLGIPEEQRDKQTQEIAALVREVDPSLPLVVGGDFNTKPDEKPIENMTAVLTDATTISVPPLTLEQKLSFPSPKPEECIDYLFVRPQSVSVNSIYVGDTTLSDHRPLIGNFHITW